MSLKAPYRRKLQLVSGGVAARRDYIAFQPQGETTWRVRSLDTGHVYAEVFATKSGALAWIDERFYGKHPQKPVFRAMAVRCRVGVSPVAFGQVYTAVSYEAGPSGFFDRLVVYIPNMQGDFTALPLDAIIFDPVNPRHRALFRHHAVAGFAPVSTPMAEVLDRFGPGAIKRGSDLAAPKKGRAA